jgi:membrane protease YdiL (CAAX protease family)
MDLELVTTGIDVSWQDGDMVLFLPIIIALVGFSVFWFVSKSEAIKSRFYEGAKLKADKERASINHILFTKFFGLFAMGIVPATICLCVLPQFSLQYYGLDINSNTRMLTLISTVVLCAITMPLAFISSRKYKHLENYPQIRVESWGRSLVLKNAIGWAVYLIGYEFLFRGILLFPLVGEIGVWPAIAINTALYSATHIPKGIEEAIGAVPLGIVLCVLTLMTGTLWIAIIVHIAMAWTNSFSSVYYHPEMKFVK